MEGTRVVSLSDLLRLSRPLTGAASLHSSSSSPPPSKKPKTRPPTEAATHSHLVLESNPDPNPNPRTFTPLNHPVLLIGTINLSSVNGPHPFANSASHCFSFSDGSSTICCAVLDFDPNIIGRTIHVLAWNFLPINNYSGSGHLEIIRWSLPVSSSQDLALPIGRLQVRGALRAVSTLFMVPSADPTNGAGPVGFLAELATCYCHFCSGSSGLSDWYPGGHSFTKQAFIYFLKPAFQWRPALTKLIGRVIEVSRLKKKEVFVGGEESYLMFVLTDKTGVSLCHMLNGVMPVERMLGRAECDGRVYNGVITGVYMQGMAVELDEKVWLLITDLMLAPQHSLRVGAIVSVRNFHLVQAMFSFMRIRVLGSCVRTSIDVKSFSLSDTRCYCRTQTQSLLKKFIESLTFSARLWVLLLVSCFRRKFAKFFSDKEILGSKNREGLAQIYARSILPLEAYQAQKGIFMDFCNHEWNAVRNESNLSSRLVIPISNFIGKCESIWLSMSLQMQKEAETVGKAAYASYFSCEGRSHSRTIRKIISSEDLGFILMGTLQISPSSGRLQLVDATGSVDVIVPDLMSDIDVKSIHEVKDYKIVLEGLPMRSNPLGKEFNEPISCRNIFQPFSYQKMFKDFEVYVLFYLRDSSCLSVSLPVLSYMVWSDNLRENRDEAFHLLLLTHKFPFIMNIQDAPNSSDGSNMFAEAIILPYCLFFSEKHENHLFAEVTQDMLKAQCKYVESQKRSEKLWSSWQKLVHESNMNSLSVSKINSRRVERRSRQIPCLLSISGTNLQMPPLPCYLCAADGKALGHIVDKQLTPKILLEFTFDCFTKYQLLCPGACYILRCCKKDLLCNKKGCQYLNCSKVLVNSETTLLSMSFSFGEVAHQNERPQSHSSSISSVGEDEIILGGFTQDELIFQQGATDVRLHFCAEAILPMKEEAEEVKNGFIRLIRFLCTTTKILSISSCVDIMRAEHLQPFEALDPQSSKLFQGKLISLTGNIKNVHIYHARSRSDVSSECPTDINEKRLCKICIHVSDDYHMVRLRGCFSEHAYPVGMGPGVNATFHRILMTSLEELTLTPVSVVVINSVKEVVHQGCERSLSPLRISVLNEDFFDKVSLGLISQLATCMETRLVRCHCRVVTIHILVLEHTYESGKSQSRTKFKTPEVKIPVAGFVLDDGSSVCCCWANGAKAETLLGLRETTVLSLNSTYKYRHGAGSKQSLYKNCRDNVGHLLDKVLKKHHRVIIKNHGLVPDSSLLDLTFSVDSDEVFSNLEEKILKFIILNACRGSNFDIIGEKMDLDEFEWLHAELLGFQAATQQMPNVWIREVQRVNPSKDGRDILHELLAR